MHHLCEPVWHWCDLEYVVGRTYCHACYFGGCGRVVALSDSVLRDGGRFGFGACNYPSVSLGSFAYGY